MPSVKEVLSWAAFIDSLWFSLHLLLYFVFSFPFFFSILFSSLYFAFHLFPSLSISRLLPVFYFLCMVLPGSKNKRNMTSLTQAHAQYAKVGYATCGLPCVDIMLKAFEEHVKEFCLARVLVQMAMLMCGFACTAPSDDCIQSQPATACPPEVLHT